MNILFPLGLVFGPALIATLLISFLLIRGIL